MDAWARDRAAADASLARSVKIGRSLEPWKADHRGWCRKCDRQGQLSERRLCLKCHNLDAGMGERK